MPSESAEQLKALLTLGLHAVLILPNILTSSFQSFRVASEKLHQMTTALDIMRFNIEGAAYALRARL